MPFVELAGGRRSLCRIAPPTSEHETSPKGSCSQRVATAPVGWSGRSA